jgi:phosphatidate cytidylyltransferase
LPNIADENGGSGGLLREPDRDLVASPAPDCDPGPAPPRAAGSELWRRVASAMVLAPLAIVSAYVGGAAFTAFWGLAAIGVAWEWFGLVSGPRPLLPISVVTLGGAAVLFTVDSPLPAIAWLVAGMLVAAAAARRGRRGWTLAAIGSAGAVLAAPVMLRADAQWGVWAIILQFAVVWTTDVVAYFVGRRVGGPRLWPAVSPKKTWSGALAGMVAAVVAGLVVAKIAGLGDLPVMAALCCGLSIVGQAGDLLESAVKRRFGTKDASRLIPGHGGLMDRLDGFVAAAVVGTLIGLLRGGADAPGRGLLLW